MLKKTFLCLVVTMMVAVFGVLLVSCGDDDEPAPMLEVSPENLQLDNNGEGTLTITSNTKWEVSSTADWLSFSTMSGVGDGQVTVRANGNSTADRMAIITIKGEGISRQAVVTQTAQEKPSEPDKPVQEDVLTINVAGVTFRMIRVEGGTFFMGATAEQFDDANDDEKPAHSVTLSSYYIGETEVTQQLWQTVMNNNPSGFIGKNKPVEYVSWNDCQNFITRLNLVTGHEFRMPTEAEWEYAARGGVKSLGYKYAGSNMIMDVAWYEANSYHVDSPDYGTHDVGTKRPNELGLYDMSGNVSEWCQDWYGDYNDTQQANPTGSSTGSLRVSRGGFWESYSKSCRVSARRHLNPNKANLTIGIRLVLQ